MMTETMLESMKPSNAAWFYWYEQGHVFMFDMFYVRQNFSQTDLDLPDMSPLLNSDRSAMTVVVFN